MRLTIEMILIILLSLVVIGLALTANTKRLPLNQTSCKEEISECIFGNEIGVNYYHFADIGKCLNK